VVLVPILCVCMYHVAIVLEHLPRALGLPFLEIQHLFETRQNGLPALAIIHLLGHQLTLCAHSCENMNLPDE